MLLGGEASRKDAVPTVLLSVLLLPPVLASSESSLAARQALIKSTRISIPRRALTEFYLYQPGGRTTSGPFPVLFSHAQALQVAIMHCINDHAEGSEWIWETSVAELALQEGLFPHLQY